jgi:hypothetical protein
LAKLSRENSRCPRTEHPGILICQKEAEKELRKEAREVEVRGGTGEYLPAVSQQV